MINIKQDILIKKIVVALREHRSELSLRRGLDVRKILSDLREEFGLGGDIIQNMDAHFFFQITRLTSVLSNLRLIDKREMPTSLFLDLCREAYLALNDLSPFISSLPITFLHQHVNLLPFPNSYVLFDASRDEYRFMNFCVHKLGKVEGSVSGASEI